MTKPTLSQVRAIANPLLSNMLVAFMNDDMDFAARAVAPVVPVSEQSGTYYTLPGKYQFKDQLERRAYGDTFARGGYELGKDTYATVQWGLEHAIPDELAASFQASASLQQIGLRWLANQSNIRKEKAFADDFMALTKWTTDNTNATDWDSTSTPVADILVAKSTVRGLTGVSPNAIIMGEIVYDALLTNDDIAGKLQYTMATTLATIQSMLASVIGLEIVAVSRAIHNVANLGQDADLDPIIDDDALVLRVDSGADMFSASSIKTFVWEPGGGQGRIKTYYADDRNASILQHQEQWDQKQISPDLGYFFSDIV